MHHALVGHAGTNIPALVAELKACGKSGDVTRGRVLHAAAADSGEDSKLLVANTLISMYAKCGYLTDAQQVFDGMPLRDVVSWNALMFGYAERGLEQVALDLFARSPLDGCAPNALSLLAALKACTCMGIKGEHDKKLVALSRGRAIHARASDLGFDTDVFVANTLIDMYAKCGCIEDARKAFHASCGDVVSWTAMILGYADNGEGQAALELLAQMGLCGCAPPNALTLVAAAKACTALAAQPCALDRAMAVHCLAAGNYLDADTLVANTMVAMYAACRAVASHGWRVFDGIHSRNVVSWNVLMLGYAEVGEEPQEALRLFSQMQRHGFSPNDVSFMAALKACGSSVALQLGRSIIEDARRRGLHEQPVVASAVVDFYSKCGCMHEAQAAFDSIPSARNNPVAWTALMTGYSRHGNVSRVLDLFHAYQERGLRPNAVTFLCILTACAHAGGHVETAREYFNAMSSPKYGSMRPDIKHYTCMVDILGKANELQAAFDMVAAMPFTPDAVIWTTVLASCRKWKNLELAKRAFDSLVEVDERDGTGYVLMANVSFEQPQVDTNLGGSNISQ